MAEPSREQKEREGVPPIVDVARYSGLGLQLAASVALFLAGGWWLDGKLGTTPLLTILGALTGAAAGFYSLYRHLVKGQSGEPPRR